MSDFLKTPAIILRRTNYGEADRILNVIIPSGERLSVMARGVRKAKSRLAGGIELLAICDLNLARGHKTASEMWTLTSAKLNTFFTHIIADYGRLQIAYDFIKQIAKASQSAQAPEFYVLLADGLAALDDSKLNTKIVQAWFLLRLAELLGGGVNTATDARGMKLIEDARYDYDSVVNVFEFNPNGRFDAPRIKFLRVLINNPPRVAAKIAGWENLIDDCLRLTQILRI
jgi:DNA repair protein RecO (recombination protein O)